VGIILTGCEETGEAIDSPAIGSMVFKAYITDPLSFNVYINGKLVGEKKQFKYYANTIRLRIVEAVSGRVIFDGDYAVHPFGGTQVAVTVYQSRPGSVPVCLTPPEDEPAPPVGYGKIAILYNFSNFPDSLKAVVENTTTAASNVYTPTDSMIVRKNEFTGFFLSRSGDRKAQVRLYPASGDRRQIALIASSSFFNMGSRFSMYLTSGKSGGAIPQLTMEKVY
jgi:hypothetical protein